MNHKGDLNTFVVILILLGVVLMMIFVSFIFNKTYDTVKPNETFNNESLKAMDNVSITFDRLDKLTFWLLIGFTMLIVISSYLIRTNSIFMPIMIILMFIAVLFAMVASNIYQGSAQSTPELYSFVQAHYPTTNFIMEQLPFIVFVIDIFGLIALFAKKGGQST
jgi:hypothetical protein